MPTTWVATVVVSLVQDRSRFTTGIAAQACVYFVAAFVTRLAIEHHESRYQIAAFIVAATILEVARSSTGRERLSLNLWAAAAVGAVLGVVLARPIAHHGWLGL